MNKYDMIFYTLIYLFIVMLSLCLIGEEKKPDNQKNINVISKKVKEV